MGSIAEPLSRSCRMMKQKVSNADVHNFHLTMCRGNPLNGSLKNYDGVKQSIYAQLNH